MFRELTQAFISINPNHQDDVRNALAVLSDYVDEQGFSKLAEEMRKDASRGVRNSNCVWWQHALAHGYSVFGCFSDREWCKELMEILELKPLLGRKLPGPSRGES